ncbi:MAG: isopeptide-forming domain-containing fimbrial protein, partial [Deltaproteobacteria bacterium]|nr:isopeptide-forming domain-containing fimbrial protein [Deltaproteobacteria bacterium]
GLGRHLAALAGVVFCLATTVAQDVEAAPSLRVTVDQNGDFAMIGNTVGWDCATTGPAPTVGTVGACGTDTIDTAPDVYWRSDDQNGTAAANTSITTGTARTTAVLSLPSGATVTHAWLYWAGESAVPSAADAAVVLDRPDGQGGTVFTQTVTAQNADQYVLNVNTETYFQSVADVTTLVATNGSGAYRVSGFDLFNIVNYAQEITFASWTLVVFYQDPGEPPRNLSLFDGLDVVGNQSATATLSGFLVPNAGFDAKLGVIAYEGDEYFSGDSLLFGTAPLTIADALTDAENPATNFFNSSRTWMGAPVSNVGDLPRVAGVADTMGSVDFDVMDITNRVVAGQQSADIEATTNGDVYFLGAFITSISTYEPNLSTSTKDVVDLNAGALLAGDELQYTITATNTGNDDAINTVMTDVLPAGVTYKAGTLQILSGPNAGAKTDQAGDDQGEYDGTNTITVRLGTGANATNGGTLAIGQTTVIQFVVTVNGNATGTISNQADISYAGQQGAPQQVTPTDGNGGDPGAPSTDVEIDDCEIDTDCGGANNGIVCDGNYDCVPGCRGAGNISGCPQGEICTSIDNTIGQCVPDTSGGGGGAGGGLGGMGGMGGMGGGMGGGASSSGLGGAGGGASSSSGVAGGGGTSNGAGGSTSSGDDYYGGDSIGQEGGCGCSAPGSRGVRGLGAMVALGLLVALRRRRRNGGR